eukprot:4876896-Prymnesium_polylepis.2
MLLVFFFCEDKVVVICSAHSLSVTTKNAVEWDHGVRDRRASDRCVARRARPGRGSAAAHAPHHAHTHKSYSKTHAGRRCTFSEAQRPARFAIARRRFPLITKALDISPPGRARGQSVPPKIAQ